jgi:uncharacterized RDD family membrane protein YckC
LPTIIECLYKYFYFVNEVPVTEKLWHYVDAQQQKIGPVAASVIKDAYQRGELRPDSLVWHSGLAQWQSLAEHANALGLVLSRVVSPLVNGREVKYANFFHRWAALMMDQWVLTSSMVLLVFCIASGIYFAAGFSFEKDPDSAGALAGFAVLAYVLLYITASGIYHTSFESSKAQGSLGKQYLGLMVTTEQGQPLDRGTATIRWFSAALSHFSQGIGFLIAAFTQRRQALHDFLAHTLVLENEARSLAAPIDRNTRSAIILLLGIFVMPMLLSACIMVPMFYFINQQQQVQQSKHEKIAALVIPVQKAMYQREASDQTCLSHEEPEIAPLLVALKPLTDEVLIGLSDDEEACEIYIGYDLTEHLSYRSDGSGGWSCEASKNPEHFGGNCNPLINIDSSGNDE